MSMIATPGRRPSLWDSDATRATVPRAYRAVDCPVWELDWVTGIAVVGVRHLGGDGPCTVGDRGRDPVLESQAATGGGCVLTENQ